MIVKNEEDKLTKCLSSISSCVDETIIVDTGSTDKTVSIAKGLGARVINTQWDNDFSKARNLSLEHATGDWIIWMDGDDILSKESISKVLELKRTAPDRAYIFNVTCLQGEKIEGNTIPHIRMFPNKKGLFFNNRIHECITTSLLEKGIPTERVDVKIFHTGYGIRDAEKLSRNAKLVELELRDNPASPRFNYYHACSLIGLGRAQAAIPYLKETISLSLKTGDSINLAEMSSVLLTDIFYKNGDIASAKIALIRGLKINKASFQLLFYLAEFSFADKNFDAASCIYKDLIKSDMSKSDIPFNEVQIKKHSKERLEQINNLYLNLWENPRSLSA